MRGKAQRNDYSRSRKVLLRTRNATLTGRAVANMKPGRPKQPADFEEGLPKVLGGCAEGWPRVCSKCLRSTGNGAQAYTGCNETLLPSFFLSVPICAEANLVKHAPRRACGSKQCSTRAAEVRGRDLLACGKDAEGSAEA